MDDVPTVIKANMDSCFLVVLFGSCLTCLGASNMTTVQPLSGSALPTASMKTVRTPPTSGKPTSPINKHAAPPTEPPAVVQNQTPSTTEFLPSTAVSSPSTEAMTPKAAVLTSAPTSLPSSFTSSVSHTNTDNADLIPGEANATTAATTSKAFVTSSDMDGRRALGQKNPHPAHASNWGRISTCLGDEMGLPTCFLLQDIADVQR